MRRLLVVAVLAYALLPATAYAAFPGANGKIAFVSGAHTFVMNPNGSGKTDLTPNDMTVVDRQPAWSPDGSKIAVSRSYGGNFFHISVMNADGTGATLVTSSGTLNQHPSWSPDGRKLVFTRAEGDSNCDVIDCGDIFTINADGTNLQPVSEGSALDLEPSWSPDGKRIAFERFVECRGLSRCIYDLMLIDPDGTNETTLLHNDEANTSPNWAPNGRQLAFRSTLNACCVGEIYRINADGTGMTQLTSNTPDRSPWLSSRDPAWAPDGTKIAFNAGYSGLNGDEIHVMDEDGSNPQRLTDDPARDQWPDWQPLNRAPACDGITAHPAELSPANRRLRRVTVSGATDPDGDPVTLEITGVTQDEPVTGPGDRTAPDARTWPDAATVLVRAERDPSEDGRVYRLGVRGSDDRGRSCDAEVTVAVRRHTHRVPIDSAPPSFDSFFVP
jgi:Tol biopolymer transport system component